MRSLYSSFVLLTYGALTSAQVGSLLPTTLPACAAQCTVLQQAATGCVPPAAPVTSQDIYQSCFCQSALLTSLIQDPTANICGPQCDAADFASIDSWYQSVCPVAGAPAATTLSTSTVSTTPSAVASSGLSDQPSSAPPSQTSADHSDDAAPANGSAWLSTHWRWVIMLIVLGIGIVLLAVLGTLWHRRYVRRREAAQNAGPRPDMAEWAPNQQNIHDINQFGNARDFAPGAANKGKGKVGAGGTSVQQKKLGSKRRGNMQP